MRLGARMSSGACAPVRTISGSATARKRQPVVHMDLFRDVYETYQNAYPPNLWSEYLPTSLEDAARYIRGKSRWK